MTSREASSYVTRRGFLAKTGVVLGGAALAPILPDRVISSLGGSSWLPAAEARTTRDIVLNPADPSNFTQDGGQSFTPGSVLTLTDSSVSDFIAFFAADNNAVPGKVLDVVATFQISSTVPVNADVGNRVVINDGQSHAAIAACVIKNSTRGIGLVSQGPISDPASYPVFVPVDWEAAPVTIRLRRTSSGDARLVEVSGAKVPRRNGTLPADQLAGPTRSGFGSVEFGAYSAEAQCTVAYSAFYSEVRH